MNRAATLSGRVVLAAVAAWALAGCATDAIPKDALRLEESTLEARSMQTRKLAAPSEVAILTAMIAVLQDMEFNIDRIEKPLGVISASKISDADDAAEKRVLFLLDLFCAMGGGDCENMSTAKDEQHLFLTMVATPSLERSGEYAVRITLQRIIFDKADRVTLQQRVVVPEVYQAVFDNLRESLFLEVSAS